MIHHLLMTHHTRIYFNENRKQFTNNQQKASHVK